MNISAIEHYRRLLARYPGLAQAMCVTYAEAIDEDSFIRAFGGDPAATATRTLEAPGAELNDYRYDNVPYTVLVTRVGDWLVGLEDNGFQGSRPEVLRGASANGRAVSVYWNVNGTNRFTYNVSGSCVVGFDMFSTHQRWGRAPDALVDQLGGLSFDEPGLLWPVGLALAERVTGVRLDEEILSRGFRRAFLDEIEQDLVPEVIEDDPALADPFVRWVVAEPTVDKLPAIARFLAHLVAADAEVDAEPVVREALEVLDERAAGRPAPADTALVRRLTALADDLQAASRLGPNRDAFRRMHAVRAIIGSLRDDPADAAFQVSWSGGYSIRDRSTSLINNVLGRCRDRAIRNAARRS